MSRRCLIWVQSLLGTGHLRRALLLAEGLAASGIETTLVSGGPPPPWPPPPDVGFVQLPFVRAGSADFANLLTQEGKAPDAGFWAMRRERLLALHEAVRPRVVVTELFPFGRRAFRAELLPLLEVADLAVASVRDVLVSKPDPARHHWMRDLVLARYDRVLVHGDPELLPFELSFPAAAEIGDRIRYTGFVHQQLDLVPPHPAPAVVVSAGGGSVGAELLRVALAARPLTSLAARPWLLVAGSRLPAAAYQSLQAELTDGVDLVEHLDDLPAYAAAAEVAVSQAGYNTVVEGLLTKARMVLVPFAAGAEDEQRRRAARLAELGLADTVTEAGLTPRLLAQAIDRRRLAPRPDGHFMADGARRSAELVHDLVEERGGWTS